MSDWQPIETAPKDGTLVLLYVPSRGIRLARWRCGIFDNEWVDESFEWARYLEWDNPPTHWALPPMPPTERTEP